MASRSFYLVSAALLAGIGLLAWQLVGDAPAPGPSAEASAASAAAGDDGRRLGVGAADYDPARATERHSMPVGTVEPGTPASSAVATRERPAAEPVAPSPPLTGSPGLNAASEASEAARPAVEAALRADFQARRDSLRKSCWPAGSDYAATFTVEATYTAEGQMVALGVPDVPGMPGVGTCLMGQIAQTPPALPQPPGVDVSVAVPIAFDGSQAPPPRERPNPEARG
ncbi:hypothetical protein [Nannocystis pusilla]|uniref:hypothetical protein n=1 Tax=Nannocystis pusilla TaxID=889268 RepID=UPI003BF31493